MAHVLVILKASAHRSTVQWTVELRTVRKRRRLRTGREGCRTVPTETLSSWRLTDPSTRLRAPLRMTKQPVGSVRDDGSLQVESCRFRHQGEQLVVRQGGIEPREVAQRRARWPPPALPAASWRRRAPMHPASRAARTAPSRRGPYTASNTVWPALKGSDVGRRAVALVHAERARSPREIGGASAFVDVV